MQLVLQAGALASESNGAEVFMLDMGEPVRIYDLAERMIRLSGRRPGTDIEIRITGVRAGEKLAEELRTLDEVECPTVHPSIMRVVPTCIDQEVLEQGVMVLAAMAEAFDEEHSAQKLRWLASTVPSPTLVVQAQRFAVEVVGGFKPAGSVEPRPSTTARRGWPVNTPLAPSWTPTAWSQRSSR